MVLACYKIRTMRLSIFRGQLKFTLIKIYVVFSTVSEVRKVDIYGDYRKHYKHYPLFKYCFQNVIFNCLSICMRV